MHGSLGVLSTQYGGFLALIVIGFGRWIFAGKCDPDGEHHRRLDRALCETRAIVRRADGWARAGLSAAVCGPTASCLGGFGIRHSGGWQFGHHRLRRKLQ